MKPYEQDAREILAKAAVLRQQKTKRIRAAVSCAAALAVIAGAGVWGLQAAKRKPPAVSVSQSTLQTEPAIASDSTGNAVAGAASPEIQNEPSDPSTLRPVSPGESNSEPQSESGVVYPFGTTNQYGAHNAPTVIAPPDEGSADTDVGTTQGVTRANEGPLSGGTQEALPITMEGVQTELGIARREETLDEATADRYIAENKGQILYSLSMSGVPTDGSVTVSEQGYTHLNLSGGGSWKELATDFRDYLIYNDDRLVAILTLWIMDGEVHASPAFGAPWFDDYNAFLQQHKGEALAFVYVGGMTEAVITPQGDVLSPMGLDLSAQFPDSKKGNYYEYLAYPENTYVVP